MALLGRFFGSTVSTGAGFAFGRASSPVLEPAIEKLRQEAWNTYPDLPLDPVLLAEGVAQGQVPQAWAETEAKNSGINGDRFARLVDIANTGPGVATAFQLWRRNVIDEAGFRRAVLREGIEEEWINDLVAVHDVLLSVDQLANAVVQGHMEQDAAEAEAAKLGYSPDRFRVLVENTGLPPGPETLLAWRRRNIIDTPQLEQGIREGHTKTKYIPFYEQALQPLLSAALGVRLYLKGWYTKEQRDQLGALHGYTSQQMEDWFLSEGRPATVHQIHIGYARGASVPGASNEEDAIRKSVKESDVRPEYADVLYASRYSLPSAFALRGLVSAGDLTADEGRSILVQSGWPPDLAAKVADSWATPAGATATENPYVAKADNQLWTALHKAYVKTGAPRAEVEPILTVLIPDAAPRGTVFSRWDDERQANTLEQPPTA